MTCPVPTSSFVSSFGAPRVGHTHQGVDMMAPDGTPIYAPESGNYRQHGNDSFYLDGDSGTVYFGTHLQQHVHADGPVIAGDVIALVGHTGNASPDGPHLHFEIHPGGGAAVDPYPATAAACTGPSPEVLAAVGYVAEVGAPPTYPYGRVEVQRFWNSTHKPNINRATAVRLTAYFNEIVRRQIVAYLRAVTIVYAQAVAAAQIPNEARWDRVAACESGGNWSINTGNGYYGGLQFSAPTWRSVGGTGLPHQHTKAEQIRRAEILKARAGLGQWPVCGRRW